MSKDERILKFLVDEKYIIKLLQLIEIESNSKTTNKLDFSFKSIKSN